LKLDDLAPKMKPRDVNRGFGLILLIPFYQSAGTTLPRVSYWISDVYAILPLDMDFAAYLTEIIYKPIFIIRLHRTYEAADSSAEAQLPGREDGGSRSRARRGELLRRAVVCDDDAMR
jgi:hypothetical protein